MDIQSLGKINKYIFYFVPKEIIVHRKVIFPLFKKNNDCKYFKRKKQEYKEKTFIHKKWERKIYKDIIIYYQIIIYIKYSLI